MGPAQLEDDDAEREDEQERHGDGNPAAPDGAQKGGSL